MPGVFGAVQILLCLAALVPAIDLVSRDDRDVRTVLMLGVEIEKLKLLGLSESHGVDLVVFLDVNRLLLDMSRCRANVGAIDAPHCTGNGEEKNDFFEHFSSPLQCVDFYALLRCYYQGEKNEYFYPLFSPRQDIFDT